MDRLNMEIYQRVKAMPVILRTAFLVSLTLGVLQIIALVFPEIAPKMKGNQISSSILIMCMSCIHIVLGLGIFHRKKWSMFLVIIFPLIQYSVFYLDTVIPVLDDLKTDLGFSLFWAVFFIVYFYFFNYKSYFYEGHNA
jgi:hypothetical protein